MKYLAVGDFHGKDMQKLEKALLIENPDSLICLGDFDQVQTIRDFMSIEKEFLEEGKEVIKVPGNHDYAIFYNLPIKSTSIRSKGKTSYKLHHELVNDKNAKDYMEQLVKSSFFARGFLDEKKFEKKYPFVVVHGGYKGDISKYRSCPEEVEPLWRRFLSDTDISLNFEEMVKRGEKIMIRGHDHFPVYAVKDSNGEDSIPTSKGNEYNLTEGNQYIINPGAFLFGHYATIDTSEKTPLLEYGNL